ncbi:divalent-cation tolerance protein CutA [Chitinibacter bivalviorum]|uniref:Divalent-cation tolerance protein CutA n=1 Tax=Chitinibacter bivalviorum TaxID=2739434 RepID=A0A7H9BFD8_9NEIS|nr:divalent-cation tolerance protein CutA [Chitinibacter bivalviorum]QLG86946.1 divalent-cation tolerance protein CutA [Chitinibacter bivalviorum]
MNTPHQSLVVWCNCPDETSAKALASGIISARLAACVNQLPAVQSTYHWDGGIETASEVPLMIKTSQACYAQLEQWLLTHHPYEVPEIIALPIVAGAPSYLAWIAQETDGRAQ